MQQISGVLTLIAYIVITDYDHLFIVVVYACARLIYFIYHGT